MSNPFTLNGGTVLSMKGKNCVVILCDTRLGSQYETVSTSFPKIFKMNPRVFFGLAGLASDVITLHHKLRFHVNLFQLKQERSMPPHVFSKLVSTTLYEKRFGSFFAQPIIAGLHDDGSPFISSMDSIGATTEPEDFVVAGTGADYVTGACEKYWEKDMEPRQLLKVADKCLQAGVNRDAFSGWGGVAYLITPEGVEKFDLKMRQD
ncbi:putative multi-domain containing protein [Aduncisulcus paluster]|uniref:Multi-domain containing protein n=1 Tax=Aduncisulcus paluster TaxID=2918883 RepID=A0ABQ5JZV1_9EUKA|nr:putative multi-domain containing protein [Aduncisulcus paluster]